ncbi:MAG TPA: SDR family oxidoreductase [Nitrososphaeraceae archaeon]
MSLLDKVIVITGASSGLGFAMAREFSGMGSIVIVTSRKKKKASDASLLLSEKCIGMKLDIADRESVINFMKQVRRNYGRVDVLINNAGYSFQRRVWFKKLHMVTEKELLSILKVDLVGSFLMSRAAIRLMLLKGNPGIIISIVSTPSLSGYFLGSPYSLAKSGIVCMTKHIALEYAQKGIRAYSIALGNIATEATYRSLSAAEKMKAVRESAMNRWGKPEEVARIAVCLANDSFSYATGNTIIVDGGSIAN